MLSIQTNVNSLVAQQNLSVTSSFQSKTIQQLTSGYRINQSGDDAAGLAVANKFRSTVAELTQGVANGNDATAQLQIMDGGMNNISVILDRLKTLATQSASGTFTGNRTTLNTEFQNDLAEIDRQAQSIGLNTGGAFAKNLDVYLGTGSGSTSLQNGVVTLGLTQSAVDSQSLGMKGLQVVNATLDANNVPGLVAKDIGSNSDWSVQNIVGNTTGATPNQMAVAGYAAFQFSGAGFADGGKVNVSVNLAGVTDVATLVKNVNSAIQQAGNGTTAAATAFKNANISASVYTDKNGGQAIAFNSSTNAFQVQAGDQMANALLGNVTTQAGGAQGNAVVGTAVTGANTTASTGFAQNQVVKMVITGGGLASPQTLTLGTGSAVSTSNAITDFKNQFAGSSALQAAGLSMSGDPTTVGSSALSFTSASGQKFNIQVTGDTANLLGLGSFITGNGNEADYSTYTSAGGYTAVTSATATGNAKLEFSFDGGASTRINGATGIDLTAGASATAAIASSGSNISTPTQIVTAGATLDLSINGTAVPTITLASTQAATSGQVASSLITGAGGWGAGSLNGLTFKITTDSNAQATITLAAAGADDTAAGLIGDLNAKLGIAGVAAHAFYDANNGNKLTIASNSTGVGSKVEITTTGGAGTGDVALGLDTSELVVPSLANGGQGNAATATLADIATQIQTAINAANPTGGAKVTVSGGNRLNITTNNKGAGNSVVVSSGTGQALLNLTAQSNNGTNMNADDVAAYLNTQFSSTAALQKADLKATNSGGQITIASQNGTSFRMNNGGTGANAGIGFGVGGVTANATDLTATTSMATLDSYGASQTVSQPFTAMQYGNDKQALTFSATDSNGALETQTITLQNNASANNRSGRSIDDAVAYINQQLQQNTTTPALQQIVAVKEIKSGVEAINFVSSLSNFTVGVAATASGTTGVNNGGATSLISETNGTGSNMSIDTQAGAKAAVAAIAAAVGKLGSAQAAVGKGQNQLMYAISLATSQITNFSSAESQIRDANVAQQAANLSKAQVLSQASIAAMAQANSAPQAVLSLLRG